MRSPEDPRVSMHGGGQGDPPFPPDRNVSDPDPASLPDPAAGGGMQPTGRREMARIHRERGDVLLAVDELQAARRESPDDVDVLIDLGATLTAVGRPADAEKELRRAQRLDPQRADAHHNLGLALVKRGLYRQAAGEFRRAIEIDEGNGDSYFYLGESLNQAGDVDQALRALERAVQFQPDNARAYFTMGILYDRKHLRQEATTMYRKARELGAA